VDTNNCLKKIYLVFDSLNKKLSSGFHLVDTFPDYFSFYLVNCKDIDAKIIHQNKLENIYEASFNNQDTILIISDVSIKNNTATLVLYIWKEHEIIAKTIHHAMNVSGVS